jgi:hypothetical protein
MAVVIKLNGVSFTDDTLPRVYRDALIDSGSLFMLDFADSFCWPKQNDPADNELIRDLVDTDSYGQWTLESGSTSTFSGGGFTFDDQTNEFISLPSAARNLTSDNDGFVFTIWIKHQAQTSGFNMVAGYAYQNGTNHQYSISSLSTSEYRLQINTGYVAVPHSVLTEGNIYQMAVARINIDGTYFLRAYVNGSQYGNDSYNGATLNIPVDPSSTSRIGWGGGYGQLWNGSVYRCWLNDTGLGGGNPNEMVSLDYSLNQSRFS